MTAEFKEYIIPRIAFSSEAAEALRMKGYMIFDLENRWRYNNEGHFVAEYLQVAINPQKITLPTYSDTTHETLERSLRMFSEEVSRNFPNTKAIAGGNNDYRKIASKYKELTEKNLPQIEPGRGWSGLRNSYPIFPLIVPAEYNE